MEAAFENTKVTALAAHTCRNLLLSAVPDSVRMTDKVNVNNLCNKLNLMKRKIKEIDLLAE